jgi:hypothetical protein
MEHKEISYEYEEERDHDDAEDSQASGDLVFNQD